MQTTWLGAIAFGVLPWLMACSGGVDTVELTLDEMAAAAEPSDEPVSETSGRESFEMHPIQTWEEAGEAYFATLQKPLSGDELEEIEQVLSNAGLDMSEIDVRGRMLAIDDILVHASEFLDGDPVEKGKTLAAINTNRVQGGTTGPQVAPHIYARDSDGEQNPAPFEFHRPYFASTHYFVVANSPTFLQPLVQSALDAIMNSADDCLHDGGGAKTLRAVTAATWASFGQGQGYMPRTFVYWSKGVFDPNAGPNACGDTTGGTAGCAGFPQSRSILISQISEQRMMAGPIIGLVEGSGLGTTYVDGNNDRSRAFVMHEVLHTLGLSHQWQAGLTVPGTSNSLQTQSILQLANCTPGAPRGGQSCMSSAQCGSGRTCVNGTCSCSNDSHCGTTGACVNEACVCPWSETLTTNDIETLDTLYSPAPGSSCYTGGFEATCWQGCTRISKTNVSGHCCYCNGFQKSLAASTFSSQVFLCK